MNAFHKFVIIGVFALVFLTVTSVSAVEAVELSHDNSKPGSLSGWVGRTASQFLSLHQTLTGLSRG